MRPYNWSYTQFSQFNSDDSLLLVSGVFVGPHNSSSGEIAVISMGKYCLCLHWGFLEYVKWWELGLLSSTCSLYAAALTSACPDFHHLCKEVLIAIP